MKSSGLQKKLKEFNKKIICFKCGREGHVKQKCQTKFQNTSCKKCKKNGHIERNCREEIECYGCEKKGHIKRDCKENKNQNYSNKNNQNKKNFTRKQNNSTYIKESEEEIIQSENESDLNE